jgi:hypothetical protein
MPAWEFAKALHLQRDHGWARFVSMQDHYNLLHREEEREMIPLCLDEGVGTIIWSPLARGRLARAWDDARSTARSATDGAYADLLYSPTEEASNRAIVDAVGRVADAHGVSRAQVALAWLRLQSVVTAPLVGAGSVRQIDDAVASLDVVLTDDEVRALEAPYTPRYDWQGVSDEAELDAIRARIPRHGTDVVLRGRHRDRCSSWCAACRAGSHISSLGTGSPCTCSRFVASTTLARCSGSTARVTPVNPGWP